MGLLRALALLWVVLAAMPTAARADDVVQPWEGLSDSLGEVYGWPNTLAHVGAVAITPPLVFDVDRPVQDYFQRHNPLSNTFGHVMLWVGGLAPALVPGGLYFGGLAADNDETASAGAAVLQAEAIQFVMVTALKWLTDRAGPYPEGNPRARRWHAGVLRDSRDPTDFDFDPTSLSGGMRWPSGHTASNVTWVAALTAFHPDRPWIPAIGYPFAAAVAIGMIEGDYHWLSDVIPGAIFGQVIGWVVGRNFRQAYDARQRGAALPRAALPRPYLLQVGGRF